MGVFRRGGSGVDVGRGRLPRPPPCPTRFPPPPRATPATPPHASSPFPRQGFWGPLAPLPVGDFLVVDAVLLNVAAEICEDILVMMYALAGAHSYTRITHRRQANRLHHEVITIGTIAYIHIKWRGGRTLLLVAVDLEALVMMTPEEQLLHSRGIAMKVDDHGSIQCEEGLKHLIIQAMWMGCLLLQDEQVGDIDHAHT